MGEQILPKKLASGVDFFADSKFYYIVRSDLNCFMKSPNLTCGRDLSIDKLAPSCRYGDHYLAHKNDLFYIIQGNSYRRVKDLHTDEGCVVCTLHPKCQGGDHYLSAFNCFYIIYLSRGVYRRTKNLNKDLESKEFTLHPDCRDGLYYFGTSQHYYFVKPHDEWGIQCIRSTNIDKLETSETFPFHPNVINFLPGGFSITMGPAYGEWVFLKILSNGTDNLMEWKDCITKKFGCEKDFLRLVNHWHVSFVDVEDTGGLIALILQSQFALTAEYGGMSINTERESWSKAQMVKETLIAALQPKQKLYIWTYQLGLGKELVLHCRDLRILPTSDRPTDVPLPPAYNY